MKSPEVGRAVPSAPRQLSRLRVRRAGDSAPYRCAVILYGTPAVPEHGIPDPEFSPYHRQVFEFIAQRKHYEKK